MLPSGNTVRGMKKGKGSPQGLTTREDQLEMPDSWSNAPLSLIVASVFLSVKWGFNGPFLIDLLWKLNVNKCHTLITHKGWINGSH